MYPIEVGGTRRFHADLFVRPAYTRLVPSPSRQQLYQQAKQLHLAGRPESAGPIYQRLLATDPRNPDLLFLLGSCQYELGRTADARACFLKAIAQRPDDPILLHDLALTYRREGDFDEALRVIDRALSIDPTDPTCLSAKARFLYQLGDVRGACEVLMPAVGRPPVHIAVAIAFARLSREVGRQEEALDTLQRTIQEQDLNPRLHASALFVLGDLLANLKRHDEAFDAFSRANAATPSRFDPDEAEREVMSLIGNWTAEAVARLPQSSIRSQRPLFIVGMPRSGTSLVEQILASHPRVFGGGERNELTNAVQKLVGVGGSGLSMLRDPRVLTRPVVEGIARSYMGMLQQLDPAAARVTDKMPTNFLHLGLIACALPGARVVHCVRDPMDTCLSCYFHMFAGHVPFAYDLEHLGRFHRLYRRVMDHWRAVLPVPIHDVVYEDLVGNLEGTARRMVEFAGLDWDPACLEFHRTDRVTLTASNDQVRKPIYTSSIGRWRVYEDHLGELKRSLGIVL